MTQLGLLGGSFNPIHKCHLSIAHAVKSVLCLDRILFIPTGDPPHKQPGSFAAAQHRLRMVQLAIQDTPGFAVTDMEIRRPGKSYSIDTVRGLQAAYGTATKISFIVGLDAFVDVPSWKESQALLAACRFVVVSRPAAQFQALASIPLFSTLPLDVLTELDSGRRERADLAVAPGAEVTFLRLPPCEVSASEIRKRLRCKESLANLLPTLVESYILKHGLYVEDTDRT